MCDARENSKGSVTVNIYSSILTNFSIRLDCEIKDTFDKEFIFLDLFEEPGEFIGFRSLCLVM